MKASSVLSAVAVALAALLGLGCAGVPQVQAALNSEPLQLEARGPGTVFGKVECAAVDALIYAYLQAQAARDERMRGGTIYRVGGGYSYGELLVAGPLLPNKIHFSLKPQDVARFQIYPRVGDRDVNRLSERPSRADRRSVSFVDPLHRPLYILHPSLTIRVYRGEDHGLVEVADLRRAPRREMVAGAVATPAESAVTPCDRVLISHRLALDDVLLAHELPHGTARDR
jgi:hypothetical protein